MGATDPKDPREVTVPGDKSLSHRALLLGALATGESRVRGILPGEDPAATARVLRALGVDVPPLPPDGSEIRFHGVGLQGLREPEGVLDCGNSGTTARLLLGILAGTPLEATVDGDASLRARPMERVTDPLTRMGADFLALEGAGRLPLRVRGGELRRLEYELPVASAQVKSSLLLAALVAGTTASLTEPGRSRDHTERLLELAGVSLRLDDAPGGGRRVELRESVSSLRPLDFTVPGDISSAAFLVALALLGGAGAGIAVRDVGLNPTRIGLLPVLERMGADMEVRVERGRQEGEPAGSLLARPSALRGTEVGADEMPTLLDEVPVLAILAARARGATRITGAAELRVKESDRLAALARNLRTLGVEVEELPDGLVIQGTDRPLGGPVDAHGDHRIAMAFGVLGASPDADVRVEGGDIVRVSYPGFWSVLADLSGGRAS